MIFNVALQPGTVLANVIYEWYVSGAPLTPTSSGVTQPDTRFSVFRIDTGTVPTGAEELIAYDSTNIGNWNMGGYLLALSAKAIGTAQQILLTAPYVPTTGPSTIIPGSPAEDSICRCYGTWKDISALSVDGEPMTLTLVAVDNTDPTLIYDLSATTLKNTETGLLVAQRVISVTLLAGNLVNVNGDTFVDLNRTDYISGAPTGTGLQYLLTCDVIGAPMSMQLLTATSPITFQTVLFELNTTTIGAATGGTFDLSEKAVT
jgi:hypothetical protein